jgi:hypothetical protein
MVKFGGNKSINARRDHSSAKVLCTISLRSYHVAIILSLIALNFYYIVWHFKPGTSTMAASPAGPQSQEAPHKHSYFDPAQMRTFNEGEVAKEATHLIIVAGHSVTISGQLEDADRDESDWYLLDYQIGKGLPAAIVAHIQAGIAEASKDPRSLLVFSGGETRGVAGPETEGASYFRVADAMRLWPSDTTRARTVTEDFARDSFENL